MDARELDRHLGTTAPGGAAPGRDPEPRHEASGHGHATSRPCDAVPHVPQARVGLGRLHEVRGVQVAVTEMEPGSASGARPLSAGRRRRRRAARWPGSGARWASGRPLQHLAARVPLPGEVVVGGSVLKTHASTRPCRMPALLGVAQLPEMAPPGVDPVRQPEREELDRGAPAHWARRRGRASGAAPARASSPALARAWPSWASAWRDDRRRGAALTRRVEDARHCRAGMPRVTSPRKNGADVPPSAPTLLSSLNVKPCTCSFSRRLNCM